MTIDQVGQDFRHAIRGLRRSPGFTITVLLTLALGLGANTTMFGVIDRLMFRPYAMLRDPETAHRIYWRTWNRGELRTQSDAEYTKYLDFRRWSTAFSKTAAFTSRVVAVGTGDVARERAVMAVSASFFEFFDAKPIIGRFFGEDEDATPRGADVAVLGFDFWKSEFGGRDVRGEAIRVGNIRATIVGVAPSGFAGVNDDAPAAIYVPITTFAAHSDRNTRDTYFTRYNWRWMEVMVRRKPGVSVAAANVDATQAAVKSWNARREFETDLPPADVAKPTALVSSLRLGGGPSPAIEARTALWVGGVAAIVLLIACANVANLMLARALKRERETAVRLALGVSRGRLAMHSLIESLVLAVGGGVLGLFVAAWSGPIVRRLLSARGDVSTTSVFADWRVIAMATLLAVIVATVTGVVPALASGRGDLARSLRSGSRGGTAFFRRSRIVLLVSQGALSVVLLVGAGLFVRSLDRVRALDLGYDPASVLVVTRQMRDVQLTETERLALQRTMLETARAMPGVQSAALAMTLPFSVTNATTLFVDGIDSVARIGRFTYQAATADYFATMNTRIVRGRAFTNADNGTTQRVVIVSEGAAQALWPGRDPLGQCIGIRVDTLPCSTVVGVAQDIAQDDWNNTRRLQFYVPLDQFAPTGGSMLLIRTSRDVRAMQTAIRAAVQRVMPGASYVTARPFADVVDAARRSWTLGATMFGAFGLLALMVASIGLYGTVAYNVTQRMHEMGVRIALGAQGRDVVQLVVRQSLTFAAAGVTLGLALSFIGARWLEPLLFRQSGVDPIVYATVGMTIIVVAIVASAVPAERATRADPNLALRSE